MHEIRVMTFNAVVKLFYDNFVTKSSTPSPQAVALFIEDPSFVSVCSFSVPFCELYVLSIKQRAMTCAKMIDLIQISSFTAFKKRFFFLFQMISFTFRRILREWLWADYLLYNHFLDKFLARRDEYGKDYLDFQVFSRLLICSGNIFKIC